MLKKKDKKDNKTLYIIVAIFIVLFLMLYRTGYSGGHRKSGKELSDIVISFFENIDNNYSLEVTMYKGEEEYTLSYLSDGVISMWTSATFPKTGYMLYKNNYYYLENDDFKKTNSIDINKVFNEKLYDVRLVKKILNKCNYNVTSLIRAKCEFKVNDFFDEYNKLYEENIIPETDDTFEIELIFDDTRIRNIKIEYDNIIKILTKDEDDIEYNLAISDINKNDFSKYIPFIEKKN